MVVASQSIWKGIYGEVFKIFYKGFSLARRGWLGDLSWICVCIKIYCFNLDCIFGAVYLEKETGRDYWGNRSYPKSLKTPETHPKTYEQVWDKLNKSTRVMRKDMTWENDSRKPFYRSWTFDCSRREMQRRIHGHEEWKHVWKTHDHRKNFDQILRVFQCAQQLLPLHLFQLKKMEESCANMWQMKITLSCQNVSCPFKNAYVILSNLNRDTKSELLLFQECLCTSKAQCLAYSICLINVYWPGINWNKLTFCRLFKVTHQSVLLKAPFANPFWLKKLSSIRDNQDSGHFYAL